MEAQGSTTQQQFKRWKQPKRPSVDGLMDKAWCLHTLEYYSVIKRNKAQVDRPTEMNHENMLSERSRIQKVTCCVIPFICVYCDLWASLVIQLVKNSPAMRETPVRFLGQEDPLEEGMAMHCSVLAWRIPRTEEPGGLPSTGSQRRTPRAAKHSTARCDL